MPVIRYTHEVEVQGWEPSLDGVGGVDSVEFSPNFAHNTNTAPTGGASSSRRQAPPTRARAATCPDFYDFEFMPRQGPGASTSIPQNSSPMAETGMSSAGPSTTSSRNAAAAGRSGSRPRSSTERKIARKLAENANYVPRPKNSFILFRTEFVAQRTSGNVNGAGPHTQHGSSDDEDEDGSQSLSKQASAVWNKMTDAEKRPYVERAKLEKAAHEAKYPHYRYKPVRHNSARKNINGQPGKAGAGTMSPFQSATLTLERRNSEPLSQAMDTTEDGLPLNLDNNNTISVSATEMAAPVPRKLSLSSTASSSSLTNALESDSRSPTPGSTNGAGLSLPTVPRVPTLTFNDTQSGPASRLTGGLPPIPRSPSAPIFDRHAVGQGYFPHPHYLAPPTFGQYPTPTFSNVTSPTSSSATAEPEPDYFRDFVRCEDESTTSNCSPVLFTKARSYTNNENHNEMHNDNNIGITNTHSTSIEASLSPSTAHYEMDEMDIDMRALLNLSPVPEVAETASSSSSTTENNSASAQRPFEAIAALWVQDQQLHLQQQMQQQQQDSSSKSFDDGLTASTSPPSSSQSSSSSSISPTSEIGAASSSPDRPEVEVGLDTYALAVSGSSTSTSSSNSISGSDFDYFSSCIPSSTSTSAASTSCLEDDLFRLDLDFIRPTTSSSASFQVQNQTQDRSQMRPGCANASSLSGLPDEDFLNGYNYNYNYAYSSGYNYPAGGDSALPGDMFGFGYDRERGLYGSLSLDGASVGIGAGVGAGAGLTFGSGYGMEYGL